MLDLSLLSIVACDKQSMEKNDETQNIAVSEPISLEEKFIPPNIKIDEFNVQNNNTIDDMKYYIK